MWRGRFPKSDTECEKPTSAGITKLCYFWALNLLLSSVVLLLSTVHGAQRNEMEGGWYFAVECFVLGRCRVLISALKPADLAKVSFYFVYIVLRRIQHHRLYSVLSQHFPIGPEENHGNLSSNGAPPEEI